MNIKNRLFFHIALSLLFFCGCSQDSPNENFGAVENVPAVGEIPDRIELPQAWNSDIRQKFWFTSQGSRIIPYAWFTWLEQADNMYLFRAADNMESLRYLPSPSSAINPAGLPVGFALETDKKTGDAWVGLTCAACHTNQIDFNGKKIIVEGAPTLANFTRFYAELIRAMKATIGDEEKFERFARNILKQKYSHASAQDLMQSLETITHTVEQRQTVNQLPPDYPGDFSSYGRLDAFGNIQNAVAAFALHDLSNRNPPIAPVSYPFLWGTPQSDVVQWNGAAANRTFIGPIVRNAGEVVGVFGGLSIDKAPSWKRWFLHQPNRYSATVNMVSLGHLESWVTDLRSPQWPEDILPPINRVKADAGREIYQSNCSGCHQIIAPDQQGQLYDATMVSLKTVGTDPIMAVNASSNLVRTLRLEGTKSKIYFGPVFNPIEPSLDLALNSVLGIMLADPVAAYNGASIPGKNSPEIGDSEKEQLLKNQIEDYFDVYDSPVKDFGRLTPEEKMIVGLNDEDLKYKARPLSGIWATAPYLHNGSVPNLRELLTEPEERITTFHVGSREFDPINVGFDTSSGPSEFHVLKADGVTIQPGNSNRGHSFGTALDDVSKDALLEFLKTL